MSPGALKKLTGQRVASDEALDSFPSEPDRDLELTHSPIAKRQEKLADTSLLAILHNLNRLKA